MTDYTQNVTFTAKDSLSTGDAAKRIKGSEFDAEFSEIATAIASKETSANKGQASGYAGLDAGTLLAAANIPQATEIAKGGAELATSAETLTGTDALRIVTPANLKATLDQNAGALTDIAALTAPGADRVLFWDHSGTVVTFLEVSTGLSISGTTLTCTITQVVDASALTAGTLPDARIQASGVTQHQASLSIAGSQLTGSIADARLSANVPLLDASNTWTSTNNYTGSLTYNSLDVGYKHIPQNAQAGNYTCVLADNGKEIYHSLGDGAGDTYTIPANSSVAYPIGTVIVFTNMATDAVSIAITTDTMYLGGTGTTGTRTLAQFGTASAAKKTATTWLITGIGLT